MDQLSDQIHQLSRELDGLDEDSIKYQVQESVGVRSGVLRSSVQVRTIACIFLFQEVADEYNRLKDLKRVSGICRSGLFTGLKKQRAYISKKVNLFKQPNTLWSWYSVSIVSSTANSLKWFQD